MNATKLLFILLPSESLPARDFGHPGPRQKSGECGFFVLAQMLHIFSDLLQVKLATDLMPLKAPLIFLKKKQGPHRARPSD